MVAEKRVDLGVAVWADMSEIVLAELEVSGGEDL
jgi:hypothetical protein